ncbi:enoyl-CoA hydratase family protein [Streptomyces sp. HSG2]|uniref:enoyl-CoA hydratase family protein n=1 Tax=Streptomyces sp. HSG2 TaxID=2797167 RepID=UPI0019073F7C|nr:enoyl-CoA hydratase family protein [Streptomyces sp. HSG2]
MGVSTSAPAAGVRSVTIDFPPVNALPIRGWYELASAVRGAGADPEARCVVLAADGRGFNAGVDIGELRRTADNRALIGVNRACREAFDAIYDCEVPVVAAVQGFCLGGGVGLVGCADAVVASEDAVFGLPELDRGALGAATHLARLVPQHLTRTLFYTSRTVTAKELRRHGSVWRVVPREALRAAALELAAEIATKDGTMIRLAKAALNGIDPVDVRRSYRYEQGFTFEAALDGVADRLRRGFGARAPAEGTASSAVDDSTLGAGVEAAASDRGGRRT